MAGEESWSSWNQDFTNNEPVLGRCSFDFDAEGHRVELAFDGLRELS